MKQVVQLLPLNLVLSNFLIIGEVSSCLKALGMVDDTITPGKYNHLSCMFP